MPKRTLGSDVAQPLSPGDIPNPFSKWASEQEPRLKEFFVRGPLFDVLFHDAESVETRFIFGPPGSGKTTYRRMLERRYRPQNRNSPILAANYFELTPLRRAETKRAGTSSHWRFLQSAALVALIRELLLDPQPFFALFAPRRLQLAAFFQELFPPSQPLALADWLREEKYSELADAIEAQDSQYAARSQKQWELLDALCLPSDAQLPESEMERLHALLMLVERCGMKQACMFVDGVDKPVEQGRPQNALDAILPLCHSLQLLDEMRLAVQFFLPQELATPLSENGVRFDRYNRYDLDWTDAQLTELLRQRLEIVSNGKISSLGQLAEEHADAEQNQKPSAPSRAPKGKNQESSAKEPTGKKKEKPPLAQRLDTEVVKHAHGSPRQLIRVADALFAAYSTRASRAGVFIQADLDAAIGAVKTTLKRDSLVPPLVIDEKLGRVLVGDREVKLSAKELQCLILLKQAKGETLSRAEIWKKLYPKQTTEPSPKQADPFFSRLRKKLERVPEHPDYLKTDRGSGFHLENVVE